MPKNRVPADHRQEIWDILGDHTIDRSAKIGKLKALFAGENFLFLSRFNRGLATEPKPALEDVEILAEAIKNSSISKVNFTSTRLNAEMLSVLLEALKKKAELSNLKFSACITDSESVDVLAKTLKEGNVFQGLKKLDLSNNSLANRVEALYLLGTNTVLTQLNLSKNRIGNEGAISLAESLKKNAFLNILSLRDNPINFAGMQALADMLKENEALRDLDLSDNILGMEAKSLKALTEALKENKTLNKLNLNGLKITPMTGRMEYLAELLEQNSTLTTLNLERNEISGIGFEVLAKALKTNTGLISLSLAGNPLRKPSLGPKEYSGIALLAEALEQNTTLTHLNLESTKMDEQGAKLLLKALEKNKTLTKIDLRDNGGISAIKSTTLDLINKRLRENRKLAIEAVEAVPEVLIKLGVPKVLGEIVKEYLDESSPEANLPKKALEASKKVPSIPIPVVESSVLKETQLKSDPQADLTVIQQPKVVVQEPQVMQQRNPEPSLLSKIGAWISSAWNAVVDFFKKIKTKLSSTPNTLPIKNKNTGAQSEKSSVPPPQKAPITPKVETIVSLNKNTTLDESSKPESSSPSSSNKKGM